MSKDAVDVELGAGILLCLSVPVHLAFLVWFCCNVACWKWWIVPLFFSFLFSNATVVSPGLCLMTRQSWLDPIRNLFLVLMSLLGLNMLFLFYIFWRIKNNGVMCMETEEEVQSKGIVIYTR